MGTARWGEWLPPVLWLVVAIFDVSVEGPFSDSSWDAVEVPAA